MNPAFFNYSTMKAIGFEELNKKACTALPAGRQASGRKVHDECRQ